MEKNAINKRKSEHIEICLQEDVKGKQISTGLEKYKFIHCALPELDFKDVSLSTIFLNHELNAPFMISSMTGGTEIAGKINKNLATVAQEKGWAMGLGSTRAALESEAYAHTFQLRKYAPTIPIFANLGAVQLNAGYDLDACKRIISLTEADGLIFHLNGIQEIMQTDGDTNFKGLIQKIGQIAQQLDVPIGVKEVGWGIDGTLAKALFDVGVAFVDVAGAGGTSWSQVEKFRSDQIVKRLAAEAFTDWGIPTAECLVTARQKNRNELLIASGGIQTGVDAAKAIALGANLVGFGRSILHAATESVEALRTTFEKIELEMRLVMFGIGVSSIVELANTDRLQLK